MDDATRSDPSAERAGATASGRRGSYTATTQVLCGPGVLNRLGTELDELLVASGAPVTVRATWLRAWVGAYRPAEPWVVAVRDQATGRLDGAAMLSSRRAGDHEAVSPLGRRQSDRGALPARHGAAAEALATAVAGALRERRGPWAFRLGQLPAGDPVATALARQPGAGARLVPGPAIPRLRFGDATSVEDFLGKGLRRQLRKAFNRLATDGVEAVSAFTRDRRRVAVALGEIERTHRARERDARRTSELEDEPGLRFWRAAILDHAARGEVEVATLHLDGELAAYVVSLLDGSSYRVFDGRCATAWARYSPGRLIETATLDRILADPQFTEVDWMNACASEKLVAANAVEHTEHLIATSPGFVVDLDVLGHRPDAAAEPAGVTTLASGAR